MWKLGWFCREWQHSEKDSEEWVMDCQPYEEFMAKYEHKSYSKRKCSKSLNVMCTCDRKTFSQACKK